MFKGCFKGVSGQFKEVSRGLKKLSRMFQENFKKNLKGISRMFQWCFVLRFCCGIDLIGATRAEGGLVHQSNWKIMIIMISFLRLPTGDLCWRHLCTKYSYLAEMFCYLFPGDPMPSVDLGGSYFKLLETHLLSKIREHSRPSLFCWWDDDFFWTKRLQIVE